VPLFAYLGIDGPEGAARRPEARPRHLAHLEKLTSEGRVRFAGPLLGEDGAPRGSLVLFEAPDAASAREVAEGDPYLAAGVFERVELHATRQVLPEEG